MPVSMQKFRAFTLRRSKNPSTNTSPSAKPSDTRCHPPESAQMHFECIDSALGACSKSTLSSHQCEGIQSNEYGSQNVNPCKKQPPTEFTFITATGSEPAPFIKRNDTKRKSIQFAETISLSEPTTKLKKRMSLPLPGSECHEPPNFTSIHNTSWLDESDREYINPSKIQNLPKDQAHPNSNNNDTLIVILNPQDKLPQPKSRENPKSRAQGYLRNEFTLATGGSQSEVKSEEAIDQALELRNMMAEDKHVAPSAVAGKCATPRLRPGSPLDKSVSIPNSCESRNCSIKFEDYAPSVLFSEPSVLEDSISSASWLGVNSDFDFDFPIDTLFGDSHLSFEWPDMDLNFSREIDSIPIDLNLTYNDLGFESVRVPHSEDFFPSTINFEDSLLSKSRFSKSESKKSQPRYPCPRCHKYDGLRAFHRKDHLEQHLRTFHSIPKEELIPSFCPHSDCPESAANSTSRAFKAIVEYRRHLLAMHGASMFECKIPGCNRVGRCGFARETNLKKHMDKHHHVNEKAEDKRGSYFCSPSMERMPI